MKRVSRVAKRGDAKGFTLIELLVVIAIIGLLASIILAALSTARAKGRDAKRIADIRDLQNALELYDETCHNYPNSLSSSANNNCPSGVSFGKFISPVPTDPGSGNGYLYTAFGSGTICTSYHIGADLEAIQTQGVDFGPSNASKCTGGSYPGGLGNSISTIPKTNNDFAPECAGSTSCSTPSSWVYDEYGS